MKSLQDTYAPQNRCFGCGPSNEKGLRIKSFVEGDTVVAEWRPEPHHLAFEGILNGGICGALLDCHSNWTAAHHLMRKAGADTPPSTVTADFHVTLKRPTPMNVPLRLTARVVGVDGRPGRDRRHDRGEREGHRHLPRHVRRGPGRAPGLPPVVSGR